MPLEQLYGLATGIGSLPHGSPAEALQLIFTSFKEIPHWPQLPRRSADEGFVAQYLQPLLTRQIIALNQNGSPYFCAADPGWDERFVDFLEMLLADPLPGKEESGLAMTPEAAAGFYTFLEQGGSFSSATRCVKGQISGPVTAGFFVSDQDGRPSFYSDMLRELLAGTLAGQAAWQARCLAALGYPVLLFIDDPAIYSYGSSSAVGLGKREIQESLQEVIEGIHGQGALAGAHCCAGADWSLLLELPLEMVSFDAYSYFSSLLVYSDALIPFLSAGGVLAWGIVPTSEAVLQESADSLLERLGHNIETLVKKGVPEDRLKKQLIITPSCGAGTLSIELAERIYRLAAELSDRIRLNYV